MTQEEKELLLKDLCARLPYHPHIWVTNHLTNIELTPDSEVYQYVMCEASCKPYLRPISSMTEEEREEYIIVWDSRKPYMPTEAMDWLNEHHFDYRNLIGKGLALEAPEDMYK